MKQKGYFLCFLFYLYIGNQTLAYVPRLAQ